MSILDKVILLGFVSFLFLVIPTYIVAIVGGFGTKYKLAFWLLIIIELGLMLTDFGCIFVSILYT